jgi:hypothetical protein
MWDGWSFVSGQGSALLGQSGKLKDYNRQTEMPESEDRHHERSEGSAFAGASKQQIPRRAEALLVMTN